MKYFEVLGPLFTPKLFLGTLPTALCVAIGEAAKICKEEIHMDAKHVNALSKRLIDGITSQLEHVIRNGDPEQVSFDCHCAL